MSKLIGIVVAGLVVAMIEASSVNAWPLPEPVAAPDSGQTEVIVFTPAVPHAPARDGYCWTPSIAVQRAGAWRCMSGNAISDPCFITPETSNAVICGANPATSEAGFLMRLTKPLPAVLPASSLQPAPWIVELAIGQGPQAGPYAMPPRKTYCSPLTGTIPIVDGLALPYACWEANVESKPKLGDTQMGLLADFNPGKVWTATVVSFVMNPQPGAGQPPFKMTNRRVIALAKVWE